MPRAFARSSLADAVARLRPGMKVLLPPGSGEPGALVAEICRQSERLRDLTLLGGIHLGDYPFARPEHAALRFATWHMSPRLDDAHRRGRVEFVPMRYFDLVEHFAPGGAWAPDCVLVHCAPPDARGYLSLGVSVSVALPAARRAPLVIAQVNPSMPRTLGNGFLHRSQIDCFVEVDEPLASYPPPTIGEVERAIGRHVAELVPDGATVQVGVGAIPQAVLEALTGHRDLSLHSLLVDASVTLVERGVVTSAAKRIHRGRMDIAEGMGTRRLFTFLHENPLVNMEPSGFVHDPAIVAQIDRFVAINSALEIDLAGQVTAESLGPRQVAGIGGQFARRRRHRRPAVDRARRRRVANRPAALGGRGRDESARAGRLDRDRARRGGAAGKRGAGTGRGAHRGRPSPVSGGATPACYFLASSIFVKISSSVGNRYVVSFV